MQNNSDDQPAIGPMIGYVTGNYSDRSVWFDGHLLDPRQYQTEGTDVPSSFDWPGEDANADPDNQDHLQLREATLLAFAILKEVERASQIDPPFNVSELRKFYQHFIAIRSAENFAIVITDIIEWVLAIRPEGSQS